MDSVDNYQESMTGDDDILIPEQSKIEKWNQNRQH